MLSYSRTILSSASRSCTRSFSHINDNTITIHVIDTLNQRCSISALVGSTLLDALHIAKVDIRGDCYGGQSRLNAFQEGDLVKPAFGEGISCGYCHVLIPKEFQELIPPTDAVKQRRLFRVNIKTFDLESSRMACKIDLTKEHDGLVIYLPGSRFARVHTFLNN